MLRGQIRQQQVKRMVRRGFLVRREAVEMLRGHFAEADHAFAQKFFRARLEFFLDFRPRIAGCHGLHDHRVQRPAAARHRELAGMLLDFGKDNFRIIAAGMIEGVRGNLKKDHGRVFAAEGGHRGAHGPGRIFLVKVSMFFHKRGQGRDGLHRRRFLCGRRRGLPRKGNMRGEEQRNYGHASDRQILHKLSRRSVHCETPVSLSIFLSHFLEGLRPTVLSVRKILSVVLVRWQAISSDFPSMLRYSREGPT